MPPILDEATEYVKCPWCDESDFDLIGLKHHLLHYCEKFNETSNAAYTP